MRRTAPEKRLAGLLHSAGLTISSPSIDVVVRLACRPIARPRAELVYFLRRFPEIDNDALEGALDELQHAQIIESSIESHGRETLRIANGLPAVLGLDVSAAASVRRAIQLARREISAGWTFNDLGKVTGEYDHFSTWIDYIRSSRVEVLVWVMNSAYPAVKQALGEAAERGVQIRVLIGGPQAVGKLRGRSEALRAGEAAKDWANEARKHDCFSVRVVATAQDLYGAGSTLIDRQIFRTTVYDPVRQHGSDGIMFEIENTDFNHEVNLVTMYENAFSLAWSRADPAVFGSRARLLFPYIIFRASALLMVLLWLLISALLAALPVIFSRLYGALSVVPSASWVDAEKNICYGLAAAALGLTCRKVFLAVRARRDRMRVVRR